MAIVKSLREASHNGRMSMTVTIAAVLQTLLAVVVLMMWVAVALWGSSLIGSLIVACIFFGIPLSLSILAAWGLWRRKGFGWWVSVLGDSAALVLLVYTSFENSLDVQDLVLILILVLPLVLLLLPATRSFYLDG